MLQTPIKNITAVVMTDNYSFKQKSLSLELCSQN